MNLYSICLGRITQNREKFNENYTDDNTRS